MRVAASRIAACGFFLAGAVVVVACYVAAHRYSSGSAASRIQSGPRIQSGDHVGNQTDLVASSHSIDFSIVPQGAVRSEIFSLTNTGRAQVVIKRVRTSCDCAVVTVARSALGPNETAMASATIDLGRSGEADDFTGGLSIEVVAIDSTGAERSPSNCERK